MLGRRCRCRVCRPEPLDDERDRKVVSDVVEHGVHIIWVEPGDGPDEPAFAYTVGLVHQARHPEVVISGQRMELAHAALNECARRVVAGYRFTPGTTAEGIIGGFPVVVDAMTPQGIEETVTWSAWFHRREVEAVQLVWPDTHGIFAWQPGSSPLTSERQPQSWRVPAPRLGPVAPDPEWLFPVPAEHLAFTCACVAEEGAVVRLVVRDSDETRGEDWQLLCGDEHEDMEGAIRVVHLAHLVRSAPSVNAVHDLRLDEQAYRETAWSPWRRSRTVPD